jgi:hypothetical protein
MRLKRPLVFLVLFGLFLAALAARSATRDRLDSPYFKGESAMVYAHALAGSEGAALDTISVKANHPIGYTPARYRADGFERAWAVAFRAARFVSEVDGRVFARRVVVFLAALCVFTAYFVARRVWDCQASGLLAAFLTAFLSPFVVATNGRVFTHDTLVPFFVTLHAAWAWWSLAAVSGRERITRSILASAVGYFLMTSWEPAGFVLAVWSVSLALIGRVDASRRALLIGHAVAVIVACLVSSHLKATGAIAAWSTTLVMASVAVAVVGPRVASRRGPRGESRGVARRQAPRLMVGMALLFAIAAILWLVTTALRGEATEQSPFFPYLVARARFLFGRPAEASKLSDWIRDVWSLDHAPLPPHTAIALFVPLATLFVAFALNEEIRARRRWFGGSVVVCVVATLALLVDRTALPVGAIAIIVVGAGAARSVSQSRQLRFPLIAAAALLACAATVFRGGAADIPQQVARGLRVANADPYSFVWVSLENTDRELVRFVTTRTSVRNSILAPTDLSALLFSFTGRTITVLPGAISRAPCERHVVLARALYGSEEELYQACQTAHIDYVVYSIDQLLDTGRYSPRYTANVTTIEPASIVFRMHFDPESLRRFTLVYENDHYRLFQVTGSPQPIFATDHPLFYQTSLLAKANRDVEAFRKLTVEVMLTYADATKALARKNAEGARRRLEWCLLQAPQYSQARLALADALMELNRYPDAQRVIAKLIEYAPDNTHGLYYAAYISAQLGKPEEAKQYLSLLLSVERDPAAIDRARTLQASIDQGLLPPRGKPRS